MNINKSVINCVKDTKVDLQLTDDKTVLADCQEVKFYHIKNNNKVFQQ